MLQNLTNQLAAISAGIERLEKREIERERLLRVALFALSGVLGVGIAVLIVIATALGGS